MNLLRAGGLIFICLFFTPNILAAPTDTDYIPAQQYFDKTLSEISSAKTSIQVFMYMISIFPNEPDSLSQRLTQALIDAKKRGVDVKVILDQNINFQEETKDEVIYQNKNQKAYELLKANGIPVFFDEADAYTHAKAIVIDGEIVILGSTNWSKAALTRNHEANAIIRSKEFAKALLDDMAGIKIQEVPAVLTPTVQIPKDFLIKENLLGEMVSQADERVFDTYLYLLSQYTGNQESKLTLDYDKLAQSLGIDHMTIEDYRRQINKVLDKLQEKYQLIKFESPLRSQNAEVVLKDLANSKKNYTTPQDNFLEIPTTYWKYDWNKTLSFPAKAMLLIVHNYATPSFFMARETIAKTHHISESFITDGTQELRKLNLLDIQYGEIEGKSYSQRPANVYSPKPFYDPESLTKELKNLEEKNGKAKLDRAKATAAIVFEENNSRTIKTLIDLEDKYGAAIVEEAAAKLADKNPDNPKRSAGYLINTIKSMSKNNENSVLP